MSAPTFSIFLDPEVSPQATLKPTMSSSRKASRGIHEISDSTTKENVNPLTGLSFDSQPPLKKRKPSSSSALRAKALPTSSKMNMKSKKPLVSGNGKDKGKKRTVLGCNANRLAGENAIDENEAENSLIALANRRAFEFTVMPLADVTQAYDESEAVLPRVRAASIEAETISPDTTETVEAILNESNDIEMSNVTSKEETLCVALATGA